MKVPFLDLSAQYRNIRGQVDEALRRVISDAAFIGGAFVEKFEQEFAGLLGVKHCIGCGNGTDSLFVIMKMLGVGQGDEVITPANSWISSSETISLCGATPVFADVDPDYFSIDESRLAEKFSPRTRAVIVVHLHGQAANLEPLITLCKEHSVHLIEDCAQSHLTTYGGKPTGLHGIAGSFSFYPGKNLGAYGDAGCIVSDDDYLANKCRMYARHGALIKHQHQMEGINSRLDGLQAAILSAKLPFLKKWTEQRNHCSQLYGELLADLPEVRLPSVRPRTSHSFHLYVIRVEDRDGLRKHLTDMGVETSIHYPTPLPFLKAYEHLGHVAADFPVAWRHKSEILSLPMFPELTSEQIRYVAGCIRSFYQ